MKKIHRKIPVTLTAVAMIVASSALCGCNYYVIHEAPSKGEVSVEKPVEKPVENEGGQYLPDEGKATYIDGTRLCPPPSSGSPLQYSGVQNVSYMAYNLAHAKEYRMEVDGTVTTKVLFISYEQKVHTYKDYKDGVMLSVDISNSMFVNMARQTCEIGDKMVTREAATSDTSKWNGRDTAWSTNAKDVTVYTMEEYKNKYGLPYTAFSVYVLSESTIDRWSEVRVNGDGTYSQTIYPNMQTATKFYSTSMQNNGGLTSPPNFHSISITYTFDGQWRVLKVEMKESYGIEMSALKSDDCSAVTTLTYDYATAADIGDYAGYFKKYF